MNFDVFVPIACSGVPTEILSPHNTWGEKVSYDIQAAHLAQLFEDNFKQFEGYVTDGVKAEAIRVLS